MAAPSQALPQPATRSTKRDLVIDGTVVINFSEPASSARYGIRVRDPEEAAIPVIPGHGISRRRGKVSAPSHSIQFAAPNVLVLGELAFA